jgi:hypothetical protein
MAASPEPCRAQCDEDVWTTLKPLHRDAISSRRRSGYNPTGPLAALALRLGEDIVCYARRPGFLT